MTQDDARARVRAEVADHLKTAWRDGPAYVDAYVDAVLAGRQGRPGTQIHGDIAKAMRDVALDVLTELRGRVLENSHGR